MLTCLIEVSNTEPTPPLESEGKNDEHLRRTFSGNVLDGSSLSGVSLVGEQRSQEELFH